MRLRLTRRAIQRLGAIGRYLRQLDSAAAVRVEEEIRDSIERLATFPSSGKAVRGDVRRMVVPSRPYIIFYRVDEGRDEVIVITIRHSSRRPLYGPQA